MVFELDYKDKQKVLNVKKKFEPPVGFEPTTY